MTSSQVVFKYIFPIVIFPSAMLLQPGLSWIRLYGPTAASKWFWGRMCFRATELWLVYYSLTLYPTGRSWQSCVHPLTRRFRHSFTLQFLSSDRSPQSSLPSQRFLSEMQRPLEHMKKEPLHKLPKKKSRTWLSLAQCPVIYQRSWGMFLTWQWILTD